ncbi:MAG: sugar phosphate isomerase/epimerase family protein [Paracoccaceae bacterium]
MSELPVVGAALTIAEFIALRDLMEEKDRDLELQDFHRPELMLNDIVEHAAHAAAALRGYRGRIGIHGPFWDFTIANWDMEVRALVQRRMNLALDVCSVIGATQMVVHSPFSDWDHNNADNYPGAREAIVARCHQTMEPIVARAKDMGVVLVIENVEDIDPMARVNLAASFESDAVGVSVDTGHAHYVNGSRGAPPVDYFIKRAGERLQHLHLQDADGHADRHWAIGDGTILWTSVFAALRALSGRPRLILELRDKGAIRRSLTYLSSCGLAQ